MKFIPLKLSSLTFIFLSIFAVGISAEENNNNPCQEPSENYCALQGGLRVWSGEPNCDCKCEAPSGVSDGDPHDVDQGLIWSDEACDWVPDVDKAPDSSFSLNMSPPMEISGSKYRKIALNGFPLSDEKPQNEEETDEAMEETYVDALTLGLTHSVTDVYIPLPGSDLALTVRRNNVGETWKLDDRSIFNPISDPDPSSVFGPAWSSNLGANVRVEVTSTASDSSYFFERYVHVTDENGASHRFVMGSATDTDWPLVEGVPYEFQGTSQLDLMPNDATFRPLPSGAHELDTLQSSLSLDGDNLIFTKKFGTKLTYGKPAETSGLFNFIKTYYGHNAQGARTSITRRSAGFYRLIKVEDRYGNTLDYHYATGNESLIPDEIRVNGSTTFKITILKSNGRVCSVIDPRGNQVHYEYEDLVEDEFADDDPEVGDQFSVLRNVTKLMSPAATPYDCEVTIAVDDPQTTYYYNLKTETDKTPDQLRSYDKNGARPLINAQHLNIDTIIDANDNTYLFDYQFDHSKMAYAIVESSQESYIGYYTIIGQPRMVSSIILPDGVSEATFISESRVRYSFGITPSNVTGPADFTQTIVSPTSSRKSIIIDAEGHQRKYVFEGTEILKVFEDNIDLSDDDSSHQVPPIFLCFTSMTMTHPDQKTEQVTYDCTKALSPTVIVDYSGNKTFFEYSMAIPTALQGASLDYLEYNPEPTSQTNAMNTVPYDDENGPGVYTAGTTRYFEYDSNVGGTRIYYKVDGEEVADDSLYLMTKMTDEEGRSIYTPMDDFGRRKYSITLDENGDALQATLFQYDDDVNTSETDPLFKGVVVYEKVLTTSDSLTESISWSSSVQDPAWVENMITEYELYRTVELQGGEVIGLPGLVKRKIVRNAKVRGATDDLETVYTYDANGNRTSVSSPRGQDSTDPDNGPFTTYFVYDALNRLTKIVFPPASSAADSTAPTKRFVYDERGNRVGTVDENGNHTVRVYDEFNRVVKEIRVMGAGSSLDPDTPSTYVNYTPATDDLVTSFGYNNLNARTSVTDSLGKVTDYHYDSLNRLIALEQPSVDVFDTVTGQSGSMRPITWFRYGDNCGGSIFDTDGFKPTHTVDPRGYLSLVVYDKLYRPTISVAQYANPFTVGTDPETFPVGMGSIPDFSTSSQLGYARTVSDYDDVGNVISVTDDLLRTTQNQYDALNRVVKTIHPSSLGEVEMRFTSTGFQYEVEDELNRVTKTEYDAAGRAIKVIQPPVYDAIGKTTLSPKTKTHYDANGNVVKMFNPLDNVWEFTFDVRDRSILETQPKVSYIDESGNWNTSSLVHPEIATSYDAVGNVISVTDARDNSSYTVYDRANRPTKVFTPSVDTFDQGAVHTVAVSVYDKNGNIDKQQTGYTSSSINSYADALSATVTIARTNADNTWDALNRLVSTKDAEQIVVDNDYDAVGNLTAVEDGKDNRTEFDYDGLQRNTVTRHPDLEEKVMSYNALVMTQRTDEEGRVTIYTYDDRNRLYTVDYLGTVGLDRTYSYDLVGNILSVTEQNSLANVGYAYDALYRISSETSAGITHSYEYDLAGNRIRTAYGDGQSGVQRRLVSTYDALNRTETIFEDDNNDGDWDAGERRSTYRYDLQGNIREKEQANDQVILKTYDALNRTSTITGPGGADTPVALPLYFYVNEYDLYGNLARITETYPSVDAMLDDRTITNTYDEANRLTLESILTGGETVATEYFYDAAHNRTGKIVTRDDGINPVDTLEDSTNTINNLNQVTAYADAETGKSVAYTYDDAGNRETRVEDSVTTTYNYDTENRLLSLSDGTDSYAYAYDYRTRRVLRDESNAGGEKTYVVFSGGTSVQEWQEEGTASGFTPASDELIVDYVRGSDYGGGIGGILYTIRDLDSGGQLDDATFNHYNSRGDVVAKVNDAGSIIYQAAYEAFSRHGDTASSQEWGTNPDRQQGNTKDEDPTGLLNEGFRYRDLETGTFITRDPLGFVDGPNVYTYVVQNPWTKFDPLGLSGTSEQDGLTFERMAAEAEIIAYKGLMTMFNAIPSLWGADLPGSAPHQIEAVSRNIREGYGVDPDNMTSSVMDDVGDVGIMVAGTYAGSKMVPSPEVPNPKPKPVKAQNTAPEKTQLQINRENGDAFEKVVEAKLKADNPDSVVQPQITLKTESGTSTRVDFVTRDPQTGQVVLTEAKSSATAPLTKNQEKAFPEIEASGATVRGAGKEGVEGGTVIPPTKVDVVRPEDL